MIFQTRFRIGRIDFRTCVSAFGTCSEEDWFYEQDFLSDGEKCFGEGSGLSGIDEVFFF